MEKLTSFHCIYTQAREGEEKEIRKKLTVFISPRLERKERKKEELTLFHYMHLHLLDKRKKIMEKMYMIALFLYPD